MALIAALIVSLASVASAAPIVVFQDDFESYTVGDPLDTSGPWDEVFIGNSSGAYSWGRQLSVRSSNTVYPGDGSQTTPMSPFGSGSQLLEYWDENTSGHGRAIGASGSFTIPEEGQYPLTLSIDYRLDENWTDFSGEWRLELQDADGSPGNGYNIGLLRTESETPDVNRFGYTGTDNTFQEVLTLDSGIWYHMEFSIDAPTNTANQPASVSIWQQGDEDTTPTFVGTFGITARQPFTELNYINISDVGPGPRGHWYVDNVNITATPEPGTMLMIASGLVGVWGVSRRRRI
jgi:hypothetical protein